MADEIGPLAFLRSLLRGFPGQPRPDDDERYPRAPQVVAPREHDRVEPRRRTVADATSQRRPAKRQAARDPPTPRPAPRREVVADAVARHPDGTPAFTPPLPAARPNRDEAPSAVPLSAPVAPAIDLSPFAHDAVVQVNPGDVLGAISRGDVNAKLTAPQGGRFDRITVAPGTQLPAQIAIRDGVLTDARVGVIDAQGRPGTLHGPVSIRGVGMSGDRRVIVDMERGFVSFFAGLFGMDNQTEAIFKGQRRVPTDPRQFTQAIGLGEEIGILGPRAERAENPQLEQLRRIIDLQGSAVTASVALAAGQTMQPFGRGLALQLAPGSSATFTRANGLDTIVLDANVTRARFGVQDGANLEIGEGHLRVTARQVIEHGEKKWVVEVAPRGRIQDATLRTPVNGGQGRVNELHLGNVTLANNSQPIVTIAGGKLTVGFDTRLENVTGELHLADKDNRRGVLSLATGRNPREALRIQARIDMVTRASQPTEVESLRINADTDGLNLGVTAPRGVQLARGEGFAFGIQSGTSLSGNGRMTYSMSSDASPNFTLESQNGVQAQVQLFGTPRQPPASARSASVPTSKTVRYCRHACAA